MQETSSMEAEDERPAPLGYFRKREFPVRYQRLHHFASVRVLPRLELEVISFTPAIAPSERSSGVATVAAMVSWVGAGQTGADRDRR